MAAASATTAVADIDDLDNESILESIQDNDDEDIDDEEDVDEDEEVDDIDVEDAFIDDGDICVPVVITFADGSTETETECEDAEDVVDSEAVVDDGFFTPF